MCWFPFFFLTCALETCCAGGSPLPCFVVWPPFLPFFLLVAAAAAAEQLLWWFWYCCPKERFSSQKTSRRARRDDAPAHRSEKYSRPFSALRWWSGCRQCRAHAVIWTTGRVHLRLSMSKRHHLRPPTSFAGYTALQWHDRQSRAVAQRLDFGLPHAWYCHRAPGGRRASRRRMLQCQQSCTSPRAPLHSCPGACV